MKTTGFFFLSALVLAGTLAMSGFAGNPRYRSDDSNNDEKRRQYVAPQRFRLGEILGAGISRRAENISNREKLLPVDAGNNISAIVRVKLDAGRSISIHDLTLIHNYKAFNCVAIRPVPGGFDADTRIFPVALQPKTYELLFLLSIQEFNPEITYRCTLRYALAERGLIDVDIRFRNFNNDPIRLDSPDAAR